MSHLAGSYRYQGISACRMNDRGLLGYADCEDAGGSTKVLGPVEVNRFAGQLGWNDGGKFGHANPLGQPVKLGQLEEDAMAKILGLEEAVLY